ncbi:ferric-dicitrate binding protein FerR (iron transport regulator) [Pedobacter cryoconitis]|uniref:FecR family protein n=1 Tax=Pedobacter cryoconitis TaxID=188932 RepID=UPI001612050E|nr:FecR domain-containing protein [Pedobacter cryoconitis]MBB6272710.1 ferric-dicitrate binding protein FerR (iron transport regulator) [Pedobacter cryoconitis]
MKAFETNEQFIYSLIIDDLDDTISPEHKVLLENWRAASEQNEKTYQEFVQVEQNISQLYNDQPYTAQSSWVALDQKIDQIEDKWLQKEKESHTKIWYSIAASVLLVLSLGYYFINRTSYTVVSNEQNAAIKNITLPDGTQVQLNGGASVKYATRSFSTNRKLQLLNGEVFVKVVHQDKYPFLVDLGDIHALDLGTSFNIIKHNRDIILTVAEGEVALQQHLASRSIRLTAGNTGRYFSATGKLVAEKNTDLNYKSWIDKDFVFTETPLSEVVKQLSSVYKTSITINGGQLETRKLTAHLHYQTPDSALKVITATLQCKVTQKEGNYILAEK